MARKYDESPEWFRNKDYKYLRDLDVPGWQRELERCAHLASEAAKREAGEPTFKEVWKDIPEIAAGYIPCYIGPPAVEAVDKADSETLGALKKHMLILQVCLGANDADIMAAVEKELRRAREWYPSPIKKPGRQTLNGSFGEVEFARWRDHKVVEISELLDWGSREGHIVTNADLGRWLFGKRSDPDKAACKAVEVRQRAFASIPALWTQVTPALPIIRSN